MNQVFKTICLALISSGVAPAQGTYWANNLTDVTNTLQGAQRVSLMSSRIPAQLLQTLNTVSRDPAFVRADVYLPRDQIQGVLGLCAGRPANPAKIRIHQLPVAPLRSGYNPVLSVNRQDDSGLLVQGPMLAGGAGETRITLGGLAISNAGAQLIAVFAQRAVLVHAC
jgi:hypothetical protein